MKKLILASTMIAAMTFAVPAMAATVDINLMTTGVSQTQNGSVNQAALSAAAAIGFTGNDVDVSSTAVSAAQLATMEVNVDQTTGMLPGLVNGNAQSTGLSQVINGTTNQASASLAGTGNLGAGSSITSLAANIGQSATVKVNVKQ